MCGFSPAGRSLVPGPHAHTIALYERSALESLCFFRWPLASDRWPLPYRPTRQPIPEALPACTLRRSRAAARPKWPGSSSAGGVPHVSPSMREVPIDENRPAIDFANRVVTGQIDIVIFMTGVGVRHLIAEVERYVDRPRFLAAISDVTTVASWPKPIAVLKEFGLEPTVRVRSPIPGAKSLPRSTLGAGGPTDRRPVRIRPAERQPGGRARSGGARVEASGLPLGLARDMAPLEANLRAIAAGELTWPCSLPAIRWSICSAWLRSWGWRERVRIAGRMAIASIGPTTSETLREFELPVDLEPEHNKMGQLVALAAEQSRGRAGQQAGVPNAPKLAARRTERLGPPAQCAAGPPAGPDRDASLFMRACRRQPVERTPIWLMRQAGRYMAEYRDIRGQTTFLELCKNPQFAPK